MQIAISGHWSQSIGADLSGQQGMSSDIDTIDIDADTALRAGTEIGASTRPAIRKIASSRQMQIERFTPVISHNPAMIESNAPSRNRQLH